MGYTTDFEGSIEIEPPLNAAEIAYLNKFNQTRRMDRDRGPYFVDGTGHRRQDRDPDVHDRNNPPEGQPGLWCHWVPFEDGSALEWDGNEKFYESAEWMVYIIDHFLKPGAVAFSESDPYDPQFNEFTFNHVCNGQINAQGEEAEDRWRLIVEDNVVYRQTASVTFGDREEI